MERHSLNEPRSVVIWTTGPWLWALIVVALAAGAGLMRDSLAVMADWWSTREEYSHGFLIPLISAYLIWQRSDRLRELPFTGSWGGVVLVALGLGMFLAGELSTIYTVIHYGFVIFVLGLAWACLGAASFRLVAIPLALLFFMVPFPNFIYNNLSAQLQLWSSEIGVLVIRLFGVSVFLEGNVIDLGSFKLQVIEACNGLRYLFPLMTLGVIVAYFYHAALWKRVFIFLSTVPITILMNSFRIGVIGVMVEYRGQSMAEGFLHQFEGWVIFMACFGILFAEMWLLMRLSRDQRSLREAFGIDPPQPMPSGARTIRRPIPRPLWGVLLLIGLTTAPALTLPSRSESEVQRRNFTEWPLELGTWRGRSARLESIYLDALKLSDYALVDYTSNAGRVVNFYAAYYASQRKGQSAHSPKSCLPGGGWVIESFAQVPIADAVVDGRALMVNRAVIAQGASRQLVYYWFQQRGRVVTNEYLVKWFVFWDSLTRNRTDGALVRVITPIAVTTDLDLAERELQDVTARIAANLPNFVPN